MPQPYFVPVRFRESRMTQSSGVEGGSSTETGFPFTVKEIKECLLLCKCQVTKVHVEKNWRTVKIEARRPGKAGANNHCLRVRQGLSSENDLVATRAKTMRDRPRAGSVKLVEPIESGQQKILFRNGAR